MDTMIYLILWVRLRMEISSDQIIYSEHGYDECFRYVNGDRVPDGLAVGYEIESNASHRVLILFKDIKYSEYDHKYWDNLELENDTGRVTIP